MICARISILLAVINVLLAYYLYQIYLSIIPIPEEFYYNTTQFLRKYGYGVEEHEVHTEDGSNLTIFRIISKNGLISRKPVLILGGLFCNSDIYAMYGPGRDLAYSLADTGYDVWLVNDRGTRYGKPTQNISIPGYEYGYHEIGLNELPASLNVALNATGAKKAAVVAISAGSPMVLALLSQKPEYNEKINTILHLGSAFSLNLTSTWGVYIMAYIVPTAPSLWKYIWFFRHFEARPVFTNILFNEPFLGLSSKLVSTTGPLHPSERSPELLYNHGFSENCFGILAHLMQNRGTSAFIMRDYGAEINLKLYNTTRPPPYDLSKVTAPSKIYYAEYDIIVDNEHAKAVFRGLKNSLVEEVTVKHPFAHLQFLTDTTWRSPEMVNDILQTLHKASFD